MIFQVLQTPPQSENNSKLIDTSVEKRTMLNLVRRIQVSQKYLYVPCHFSAHTDIYVYKSIVLRILQKSYNYATRVDNSHE